jgi:hypothetical protein
MTPNSLPSERVAVVGVIDPDAYSATTIVTNTYIPLKDFHRYMAIVSVGDMVSTAKLNAKIIAYTSDGGAGAFDVPGCAITALTQAGSDDNKQAIINFDPSNLPSAAYTHFKLSVTLTDAGADMGAVVLGIDPRYAPASDNDVATVDEIVSG